MVLSVPLVGYLLVPLWRRERRRYSVRLMVHAWREKEWHRASAGWQWLDSGW